MVLVYYQAMAQVWMVVFVMVAAGSVQNQQRAARVRLAVLEAERLVVVAARCPRLAALVSVHRLDLALG
jgi:hypothetical protein